MRLTLKDLHVDELSKNHRDGGWDVFTTRPASLADLVEVLKQEGAEELATSILNVSDVPVRVITIGGPSGRYLILPLGDTP